MRSLFKLVAIVFIGFLFSECNDPTLLGSELLKQDEINLNYIDTFTLEAQTILDTGQSVYYPQIGHTISRMAIGKFQDAVFGETDARLFIQFLKPAFASLPDFKGGTLDSAILFLVLDSLVTPYGVPFDNHDFEIREMNQSIKFDKEYKVNNIDLSASSAVIGALTNVRPDPKLTVRRVDITDTITYDPHIAIKMNNEYAAKIMNLDTLVYNSDSIWLANVRGIEIRQANANVRMLNFNPNSSYSKLSIYYHQGTTAKLYSFPFNQTQIAFSAPRVPMWKQNHNAAIKNALSNKKTGEQFIYLQSLGGLKAKIDFPYLKLEPNSIINKAELEFTVVDAPGDDPSIYSSALQLALYKKDSATAVDLFISDQAGRSDYSFLGGRLVSSEVNGATKKSYIFNISNHIQRILVGKEKPEVYVGIAPEVINQVIPTPVNLSRVILGGTKHATGAVKLRISYTTY